MRLEGLRHTTMSTGDGREARVVSFEIATLSLLANPRTVRRDQVTA